MYQLKSARAIRSENAEELRRELNRLREEFDVLRLYKETAHPILADLALNPFADMDKLRGNARSALALARRRNAGAIQPSFDHRGTLRAVGH